MNIIYNIYKMVFSKKYIRVGWILMYKNDF